MVAKESEAVMKGAKEIVEIQAHKDNAAGQRCWHKYGATCSAPCPLKCGNKYHLIIFKNSPKILPVRIFTVTTCFLVVCVMSSVVTRV